MPNVVKDIFVPRQLDIDKPKQVSSPPIFDKTPKYTQAVLQNDPVHKVDGKHKEVGAPLLYLGKFSQPKERFVIVSPLIEYFTYYCYEIYQFCGINTPKSRYASQINYVHPTDPDKKMNNDFALVSTLIPPRKIKVGDIQLPNKVPFVFKDENLRALMGPKLVLQSNQSLHKINDNVPQHLSGNFFGSFLVDHLLQNPDSGAANGYLVEYQQRQHFFVIDMGSVDFSPIKKTNFLDRQIAESLGTKDQHLAVVVKILELIKPGSDGKLSKLEEIYYHPSAINMYFKLVTDLAVTLLTDIVKMMYSEPGKTLDISSILPKFRADMGNLLAGTPKTAEGLCSLCEKTRQLILEQDAEIRKLPEANSTSINNKILANQINDPIYFPDLQIKAIEKNAKIITDHLASPQELQEFQIREEKRNQVAEDVLKRLDISPPENLVIKNYIVEDLRGKYYDLNDANLIEILEKDLRAELNLPIIGEVNKI